MLIARITFIFMAPLFLDACALSLSRDVERVDSSAEIYQTSSGSLDFNWRLTGDRSVGPSQVFSDDQKIWIHWQPKQTTPILSAQVATGEQLLSHSRQGDVTVISGAWDHLYFRRGRKTAEAKRTRSARQTESVVTTESEVKSPTQVEPPLNTFSINSEDGHLRKALSRWSVLAGWLFLSEHWVVDVDIPIAGYASFGHDFEQAVKSLMSATELSDRPLQACFYSNRVLRVVSVTQTCDSSTSAEVRS